MTNDEKSGAMTDDQVRVAAYALMGACTARQRERLVRIMVHLRDHYDRQDAALRPFHQYTGTDADTLARHHGD